MRTVNDKGSIGVAKVLSDLLSKDYFVFMPFDGASPVDLVVADKRMNLRRLQIKYRVLNRYGSIGILLSSVVNGKTVPIDVTKIDGWAIYCPQTDLVYYVSLSQITLPASYFSLRSTGKILPRGRDASEFMDASVFWKVNSAGPSNAC